MKNVKAQIEDDTVKIEVDLTKEVKSSRSGNTVVATTEGNVHLKDDIYLMVNVFKMAKAKGVMEEAIEEIKAEQDSEKKKAK